MSYFFNFDKLGYLSEKKPDGCILCLIRDNSDQTVNLKVFEDDLVAVSVNLYPYNPGHLIIFPTRHIKDIREFTKAECAAICDTEKKALTILDALYKPHGYNIGYNMGNAAGASIEHLHLHIIPRYPGEAGIADLIAGQKVLVENPLVTWKNLKDEFSRRFPS